MLARRLAQPRRNRSSREHRWDDYPHAHIDRGGDTYAHPPWQFHEHFKDVLLAPAHASPRFSCQPTIYEPQGLFLSGGSMQSLRGTHCSRTVQTWSTSISSTMLAEARRRT